MILSDEAEIIDPMGKLRGVYPNIMSLSFENTRTNIDIGAITADVEAVETLSPYKLFCEFFLNTQGNLMSVAQDAIVCELFERLDAE